MSYVNKLVFNDSVTLGLCNCQNSDTLRTTYEFWKQSLIEIKNGGERYDDILRD